MGLAAAGDPLLTSTIAVPNVPAGIGNSAPPPVAWVRRYRGGQLARRPNFWMAVAVAAACAAAAPACGRAASSPLGKISPVSALVATTPADAKTVRSVVWATNRDVISLDPIFALGYPEYTAESLMCESLLRQAPDGSLEPGLATVSNPSPTRLVFTLRHGVKFWDGHPVTSADVVYSLDRQMNPKLAGSYGWVFDRVATITATSPAQVTITLRQPDYWRLRRGQPQRRAGQPGRAPGAVAGAEPPGDYQLRV